MNKIFSFIFIVFFLTSCSLNKNSKFWTSENLKKLEEQKFEKIFGDQKALGKELNTNINLNLISNPKKNNILRELTNNDGQYEFDGLLKKSSKYKFSKIKNFNQLEPVISFNKDNVIFFDDKGTILKFNKNSKLVWKKNYYSKIEKKLDPILQFANNNKYLIVADNLTKYYMLDLRNGNLIWSQRNLAPFNSQIKIYKDRFFIIDFTNTLRCISMKNGEELWNHAIPFTAQGTPMTYLSPQGNQTLIVVVPVFNSTRGSGYEPLPAEEEDPLGGYIFAFRLPES